MCIDYPRDKKWICIDLLGRIFLEFQMFNTQEVLSFQPVNYIYIKTTF